MDSSETVEPWVAHARGLLPPQNPLWAFVHNNQLQAFETQPFGEGIRAAAALYRGRPTESEAFFREELARGRIHRASLEAVLAARRPHDAGPHVDAFLADPQRFDDVPPVESLRLGARLESHVGPRYQRQLQDFLVPLVAGWLDQGMAGWSHPWGHDRFWAFFEASVRATPSWGFDWADALKARLDGHARARNDVDDVIEAEVRTDAPDGREADYCAEVLFVLKGWSGVIARLEAEPTLAPVEAPPVSLKDWLAALLVTTHALDDALLAQSGLDRERLRATPCPVPESRGLGRLLLWQEAYERSFAVPFLQRVEAGVRAGREEAAPALPSLQVLTCMDDREESFRRALERNPGVETTGVLGHFLLDMRFEALGAARATRQCPPVVEPTHALSEVPLAHESGRHGRADALRRAEAAGDLGSFDASRSLVRGFVVSLALGLASFLPLLFKVLAPSFVARFRKRVQQLASPHPETRIALDGPRGYDVAARADVVEALLRTFGVSGRLAPVVAVVGHGATMTNNPFRQAYGCGACSGNPGAPNARALAAMANDPAVRALLAERGLTIPAGTRFIPFLHDTTADVVTRFDDHDLPPERRADADDALETLNRAARANAVERSLRLASAPRRRGTAAVVAHVLDRAHDLAQPRPEYGHNRTSAAIVAPRRLTRGISLDRRAYLVSYDAATDPDGTLLPGASLGSVPVAANITLDYFFSRTDPEGFGAGSKLPVNVTSILGLMTGSKSDLRIGLARQMTELHEPMRPFVLVAAPEERLRSLVSGHARLSRLVRNRWMQLGRIDPETGAIELWDPAGERFRPWREALPESGATTPFLDVFDPANDRVAHVAQRSAA